MGKRGPRPGLRGAVVEHPARAQIELGLANRISTRVLAKRYGISRGALTYHLGHNMPEQLIAALRVAGRPTPLDLDALKEAESEGLLQHLVNVRARLYRTLDVAETNGDVNGVSRITTAIHTNLRLAAQLVGELQTGHHTTVQMLVTSEPYLDLRHALLNALRPYPEARGAVARVLRERETEGAKQIEHAAG